MSDDAGPYGVTTRSYCEQVASAFSFTKFTCAVSHKYHNKGKYSVLILPDIAYTSIFDI